ncbi:WhiB family transcriptional regulator [Streptomyces sp. NPDC048405]|uniref:WhiB family transcriptional regulator n=1 Tax=Streptomyces TaxID=1883 RepID=UPI0016468A60|nr:WhiB family transcriptional regulator [Streptomyces salinarius]WST99132.1 WhiB family transcriptional regulator [Streptomyces sp. NBC_01124]WSU05808.1 WhiB family transcriptional regulator [Streptomyces sp. NBC_01124]
MDWREKASCRHEDPDLFFPVGNINSGPSLVQVDEAKAVCHRCPVMETCLNWAIGVPPMEGIWGGTTESERRAIRRQLARRTTRTTVKAVA